MSNSVCMEEGPRGVLPGFEGAGSPQGRPKGAADQNRGKTSRGPADLAGHVVEFRMLCRMLGVLGFWGLRFWGLGFWVCDAPDPSGHEILAFIQGLISILAYTSRYF